MCVCVCVCVCMFVCSCACVFACAILVLHILVIEGSSPCLPACVYDILCTYVCVCLCVKTVYVSTAIGASLNVCVCKFVRLSIKQNRLA